MSVKHFCDVCGEPARESNWEYACPVPIASGQTWDKKVVYVDAIAKWKIGQPKNTDSVADICKSCYIEGLQKIIEKLRAEK